MTIYTKEKNTQDNEKLQEVFKIVSDLKITVTRNSKIDGRMGCGLGYNVKLRVNNKQYSSVYNNSQANGYKAPDVEDILYCIISDAHCYESTGSFEDFCDEFGYDRYTKNCYGYYVVNKDVMRIFDNLERTYNAINRLFTSEQIEQLKEVFQDY